MPRLTTLHIDKSSQMNLAVLSRFRDIKTIHINTLLNATVDDGIDIYLTQEPLIRVVPFLSRITSLERVIFNVNDESTEVVMNFPLASNGYFYAGDEQYPDEGSRESMLAFLDHLSGAYRCGAFAKKLRISGICCPDTNNADRRSANCETCLRACQSFPLKSVAEFECRGSSENNARSGRTYGLDVCLECAQIESIIESREGGHELLRSSHRLMRLLSCGRMYRVASEDGGKVLHLVKYKTGQIEEIKRVIEYAELDVKKLPVQEVQDAIMNSFDRGGSSSSAKWYLSVVSLDQLKDEIGLPIVKDEYVVPLVELVEYTPHFINVLRHRYQSSIGEDISHDTLEYIDIEVDCLKLLHRFISEQDIPPIQQMANVVSCLAKCLQSGSNDHKKEAATFFMIILDKGTNAQRQMIMDDSTIVTSLSILLDSDDDPLAKLALNVLADICGIGSLVHVTQLARAGAIPKLVNLLSSKDNDHIKSSLLVLQVVTKDHVVELANTGVVASLTKLLESKLGHNKTHNLLVNSSLEILLGLKDHLTTGVSTESLQDLVSILIKIAQDRLKAESFNAWGITEKIKSDSLAACTILLRKAFQDKPRLYLVGFDASDEDTYSTARTYDALIAIMKVTKTNKVEVLVQENMAHAIANLLAESNQQALSIIQREGFFSSGVVESLGQLLGSSAADDKVILLAITNIVLEEEGFATCIDNCGCESCEFKRLLATTNPIPKLNNNLASSEYVNALTVLFSLQDHIGLRHHAMLISSLMHLMETSSSKVLGDIAKGSNIGSINIGSDKRSAKVLKPLPESVAKKPQYIRFRFGLAPPGSKLILCRVGSNGKLHHLIIPLYIGSRPLDLTEKTHTGDAFVVCLVPFLSYPTSISALNNDSACKVLCSYRVEKAVDENLYRHDIKWTPEECVVSRSPKDGIDQTDLIYYCSILLHKIYQGRCQLITQLDNPSRLLQITKIMVNQPGFRLKAPLNTQPLNIQSNLLLAVVSITARLTLKDIKVVEETGILPLLVNLVVSRVNYVSKKALIAVGRVASVTPIYQDMLLQAGIMKRLMILLMNPQSKRSKLKLVLLTYARCCQGKSHDAVNCKSILSILSRILFIQYDEEMSGNACCSLFSILNGMEQDQVQGIDLRFVEHLLKMLPSNSPNVQLTVLKTLHLLANTGETCIKAIIDHNGMICLCNMLSSQCETSHKLAFDAIRCIISVNKKHMQTAINNGIVQYLCQMLANGQNKEESMQAINTILSSGCESQIKSLLDQIK